MLVQPARRSRLIAMLRIVAMTWGAEPVRTWERSPAARGQGQPATNARQHLPLTDDERAAVDDGQTTLDRLLQRLVDVPTPAGSTPRQIGAPAPAALLPIVAVNPRNTEKLDK